MAAILNSDPDVAFAGARVLFICVIVFQWDELIVCASLIAFMDIEETSAVKLLYADEFELYTEEIPPVWRVVITCICVVPTVGGI